MKSKKFMVIDIDWEGPFPVSYDREEDKYNLSSFPETLLKGQGFYQIYGSHPTYGKDALLYIGETKNSQNGVRGLRKRLSEHLVGRFLNHTHLSIYIGICDLNPELMHRVESILIFSHAPALNRKHIDKPKSGEGNLLVRNWSFIGDLESVCTDYWEESSTGD